MHMREWMKLFEQQAGQHTIEIIEGEASAEGYVVNTNSVQIANWFQFRHKIFDAGVIEHIQSLYSRIAFLNNINVPEEDRNTGQGTDLLNRFESEAAAHGAQAIILLSDEDEDQQEGFDLTAWYVRNDYEELPVRGPLPLMIKAI